MQALNHAPCHQKASLNQNLAKSWMCCTIYYTVQSSCIYHVINSKSQKPRVRRKTNVLLLLFPRVYEDKTGKEQSMKTSRLQSPEKDLRNRQQCYWEYLVQNNKTYSVTQPLINAATFCTFVDRNINKISILNLKHKSFSLCALMTEPEVQLLKMP